MKFSLKVFLCTVMVIAAALSFGGFYLIDSVFRRALERETQLAFYENEILRFTVETSALNIASSRYGSVQDTVVAELAAGLESGGRSERFIRISARVNETEAGPLYASGGFFADVTLLPGINEQTQAHRVLKEGERYFIQTAASFDAADRMLYLETLKDISTVFAERDAGFALYRRITLITLAAGATIMYALSYWLTRPIKHLTAVAKSMAEGHRRRAKKMSGDEIGILAKNFNDMADSLEEKMFQLQDEADQREDFVAAFAHELKTPLTAIIGYADLLRSRKLDDENNFKAAEYIYREGRRLETLSFRLLDIMVLKRRELVLRPVPVKALFKNLNRTFGGEKDIRIETKYEDATVEVERALILTVLVNLIDNACKASEPGGLVEVTGAVVRDDTCGFRFSVKDYGIGIPGEDLSKITRAFYMVDKSRSRSQNGAGLGLALCEEILNLHGSGLEFESELGKGTCVSFMLTASRSCLKRA